METPSGSTAAKSAVKNAAREMRRFPDQTEECTHRSQTRKQLPVRAGSARKGRTITSKVWTTTLSLFEEAVDCRKHHLLDTNQLLGNKQAEQLVRLQKCIKVTIKDPVPILGLPDFYKILCSQGNKSAGAIIKTLPYALEATLKPKLS